MTKKIKDSKPNLAGVPEEIQANIKKDLKRIKNKVLAEGELLRIGVSVSDNENLAQLGYSPIHLKDLMIEIVRSLLINNFMVVYGGDLRKEGYTMVFSDLARQYTSIHASKTMFFENYFAFPISCELTRGNELDFKQNRSLAIKVSPPASLCIEEQSYIPPDTVENRFIWARSLSYMRQIMIKKSDARILIGGKVNNYLGYMPGVMEEAHITLEQQIPLYLVGAYGGCAQYVAAAICGKELPFKVDAFHTSDAYVEFRDYYNAHAKDQTIDFARVEHYFQQYGLKKLAKNNGLSMDENRRLFITPHINEILYLIFKGLRKVNGIKSSFGNS